MGEMTNREGHDVQAAMPIKLYPVVLLVVLSCAWLIFQGGLVGVLLVAGWLVSGGRTKSIQTFLYGSGLFLLVIIPLAMVPIVLMTEGGWVETGRSVLPTFASAAYLVWVTTRLDVRAYFEGLDARRAQP